MLLAKLFSILTVVFIPPLGFLRRDSQTRFLALSVLLWALAVYLFFEVAVLAGLILHFSVAGLSSFFILTADDNARARPFDVSFYVAATTLLLILVSFILVFSERIESEQPSFTISQNNEEKGKRIFGRCAACHSLSAVNSVGPHLVGIYGRKAGSVSGYRYSEGMLDSGIFWTDENLQKFLTNQNEFVPGTRMIMSPMPEDDIREVIEFLKTK